ncbi:MAG: hypothetical protein R2715_22105 [Ilumatobacteraceae bacterium]
MWNDAADGTVTVTLDDGSSTKLLARRVPTVGGSGVFEWYVPDSLEPGQYELTVTSDAERDATGDVILEVSANPASLAG